MLRRRYLGICAVGILCLYALTYLHAQVGRSNPSGGGGTSSEKLQNVSEVGISLFDAGNNPYRDRSEWKVFLAALERYKTYHREKLKHLRSSPDGGGVKTLTWACSQSKCSGLGDQLLRLQYFLLLAMMSDRVLTVYWDEAMKASTQYLLPGEIDWNYFNKSKGMCDDWSDCSHQVYSSTSFWNFGWTRDEFAAFGKVLFSEEQHITVTGQVQVNIRVIGRYSVQDPGELIAAGMQKLGLNEILSKDLHDAVHYQHASVWYDLLHSLGIHRLMEIPRMNIGEVYVSEPVIYVSHTTFTYLFRFSQDLTASVEKYQRTLGLYGKDYLSFHLRTGFIGTPRQEHPLTLYVEEGWKFFGNKGDWKHLIEHAVHMRDQTLGLEAPIYLSTDTVLVKDMVRSHFNDKKFIFSNLTAAHSKTKSGTSTSGNLAMWLDFFMLANGRVMVHSDSSFSTNAAYVRPIPNANHSWVQYDDQLKCLASYRPGSVNCV